MVNEIINIIEQRLKHIFPYNLVFNSTMCSHNYVNVEFGKSILISIDANFDTLLISKRSDVGLAPTTISIEYADPYIINKIYDIIIESIAWRIKSYNIIEFLRDSFNWTSYDMNSFIDLFDVLFKEHIAPMIYFRYNIIKCEKCEFWHQMQAECRGTVSNH